MELEENGYFPGMLGTNIVIQTHIHQQQNLRGFERNKPRLTNASIDVSLWMALFLLYTRGGPHEYASYEPQYIHWNHVVVIERNYLENM
jgi:hypothetical protein